jgi:DNA-directed RNA polymerase specialized sigma24 family protein
MFLRLIFFLVLSTPLTPLIGYETYLSAEEVAAEFIPGSKLYRLLESKCRDRLSPAYYHHIDCEDIIGDLTYRIFKSNLRFQNLGQLITFSKMKINHLVIDKIRYLRGQGGVTHRELWEEDAVYLGDSADITSPTQVRELLKEQGVGNPDGNTICVLLMAIEGYTSIEIAEKLGYHDGSIRRIIKRLREPIERRARGISPSADSDKPQ